MPFITANPRTTPSDRRRRLLQGAAVTSATILALSGCTASIPSSATAQSASAADKSHDDSWQQENFASFYTQKIDWRTCTEQDGLDSNVTEALDASGHNDSSTYQCGTVKAPINWADPTDTRTVDLAIVRIPSTAKDGKGKPLFNNPGGPGASGVTHAMSMPAFPEMDKIRQAYEIWGFDPRGVGNSAPLDCETTDEASAVRLSECIKKHPVTQYMGTSHVARDMEMLRVLSGAEQLDYHGYSYGTLLGATYATLFPDKAGRMILDSADDAQWASLTSNFDQQVAVSKAVGKLADSCSTLTTDEGEPVTCPFTSEREMLDYINTLNEAPLKPTEGEEFTGKTLRDYLTTALYMGPGTLLDLLGKAKAGDQESIDSIVELMKDGGAAVGTAGILAMCPSSPKKPDVSGLIDHMKEVGVPEFVGGPELTEEVIGEYAHQNLDCAAVPSTGTDLTDFDASKVKTPILVVGITGDHATPYEHAVSLTKQLGNANLLTIEGDGHGGSFSGRSLCADEKATAYLLEGKVPEAGATCQMDPTM
ncbi:alpha/beta hydrolase [Schaalia vaccimaxillae]|uniref:alpha/beta hydrolase n=1 Tax=Schaalia vaccimaxillae TaxID=183916 RepID=UPI0003B330D2|nr:alpha/beta hydrolase [Schaalia vaccimaxillae]